MTTLLYEKPEALRELRTDRHGLIAASAGTGKTYTLQHLVVEILLDEGDEVRLDEILLVTYTVAATSDLKAKIRETLEQLITGWERARSRGFELAELRNGEVISWSGEVPPNHWAIDLEGVKRLRHGLRNFDRAAIYTIHGFCQRILVEHAFANRRLFEQEHVSRDDVIAEAFAAMLREDIRPGSEEEKWLSAYLGAGKKIEDLRDALTDFVTCTGEYRPVETVDLDEFQDFTKRLAAVLGPIDAEEWKAEIKPLAQAADGPSASTSNTTARRLKLIQDEFLSVLKPEDPVANLFALYRLSARDLSYLQRPKYQIVLSLVGEPGELLDRIDEFYIDGELLVVTKLGELLARRVAKLKLQEGYFTFDDMIQVVRDTLIEDDEGGHLLESIRAQFRYGLIDEFQDTDQDQWEIFSKIFVDSPYKDRHFLYLIGDPKQAIYGFRGGDVYTYLDACERLRGLASEETSLTDNYRSTPALLAACNAIFDDGAADPIPFGDRINYEGCGVNPGKPWLELRDDGEPSPVGMTAVELRTEREKVGVRDIRAGLVDQYARQIRSLVNGERRFEYRSTEDSEEWEQVGAEDIYILCRRRKDLDLMAEALRRQGVPFAFLKKPGLFQTKEALDVYDLLLAIDDPYDRSRRARAWMTPFFDLQLNQLEDLAGIDEREQVFEKLLRWSRMAHPKNTGQTEPAQLFGAILEQSGLIRRRLLLERGERELTNYLHLFEILSAEAGHRGQKISELAARLKLFIDDRCAPDGEDTDQQRIETEEKAVQLMTIHASKGLQRGVVFVVPRFGIINTNPPFRFHEPRDDGSHARVEWYDSKKRLSKENQERFEQEAIAEELRLAYVALTRAELMLYMPFIEKDSVLRSDWRVNRDPFMKIMDRVAQLGEEQPTAKYIERLPVSIDIEQQETRFEEVRANLAGVTLFEEEPHQFDRMSQSARLQLMLRRWEVTSYSKLKQRRRTTTVPDYDEKGDVDPTTGVLPGGMATGNFLHLVLEDLDYQWVDEFDRRQWVEDEPMRAFFESRAARYGRYDEPAITVAMEIVYDTLRAPVELDDSVVLDGIKSLDPARNRREVEFLFPVPELDADGETWHRVFRSGADVEGGFATGVVDLLFEHEGKVYFADWKSDLAHPFDTKALNDMVQNRYATQANLYSLALCRMLGIEDRREYDEYFGGYFYFFIRGMSPEKAGRGIYGGKVDWSELQTYEQSLFGVVQEAKQVGMEA